MNRKICLMLGIVIVISALFMYGCEQKGEKYCKEDKDCLCGVHIDTRECFYGNNKYVDVAVQCPDYCTGIAGNLGVKCINGQCEKV